MEQVIPAGQRLAGVFALEVVGRIEQVLPTGLPLAARQRAKGVKAASDGRDKAAFAAAISSDGAEHRRRRLMGAVGPAKALDGPVGAPARLEQEVHPPLLILGIQARVVGSARAAGIREDEDTLGTAHEGIGIGKRLVGRARLQTLAAIRQGYEAPGAPCNLGDGIRAEAQNDGIERGDDGRQGTEQLQCLGLDAERVLRVDGVSRLIEHRARTLIAVLVPIAFHGARRESIVEVVGNDLPRR